MIGRFLGRMILLGWGDIKLMGVCALVLPLEYLGVFCILTGLFGLLYRWIFAPNTLIPFAPSIGLAFFAVTLWMGVSEKDLFFSSI
jgi:prepilin signal peptidase PulO-like enzyme (type II secretory pathway)